MTMASARGHLWQDAGEQSREVKETVMTNLSMAGMFRWKLHGDGKTLGPGEVVEPNERLT